MAPHESDSSDEDVDDYTTTNVLLGYASKGPSDDLISSLGGRPKWLDPARPASAAFARCKICNDIMPMLLQLQGDLPEYFLGHERRLYIFGCRRRICARKEGSIRVIRGIRSANSPRNTRKEKNKNIVAVNEPQGTAKVQSLGSSIFGTSPSPFITANLNPFSTSSSNGNHFSANPFVPTPAISIKSATDAVAHSAAIATLPATFAEKARLSSPPQPLKTLQHPEAWPSESDLPQPYPSYYLDADYETLDAPSQLPMLTTSMDIDDPPGVSSSSSKEDAETFESTIDKTFQRFADRLAQNPLQILRYEFRGMPLLYSKTDAVGKLIAPHLLSGESGKGKVSTAKRAGNFGIGIPACGNCGSGRVFELQLTPQAITELEGEEVGLEGMEWGTVIVGVCGVDCGGDADGVEYVEEWAGVQWEERGKG